MGLCECGWMRSAEVAGLIGLILRVEYGRAFGAWILRFRHHKKARARRRRVQAMTLPEAIYNSVELVVAVWVILIFLRWPFGGRA